MKQMCICGGGHIHLSIRVFQLANHVVIKDLYARSTLKIGWILFSFLMVHKDPYIK
jgi:hypothetical protein